MGPLFYTVTYICFAALPCQDITGGIGYRTQLKCSQASLTMAETLAQHTEAVLDVHAKKCLKVDGEA